VETLNERMKENSTAYVQAVNLGTNERTRAIDAVREVLPYTGKDHLPFRCVVLLSAQIVTKGQLSP
jgi:hypothetical protein